MQRSIPYTYLASPYTHPDSYIRECRFKAVCLAAATLMGQGRIVFCPIAHSHPIELMMDTPGDLEFWQAQDAPFLWGCADMVVLTIPGWKDSRGVLGEIEVANTRGIPIQYMDEQGVIT